MILCRVYAEQDHCPHDENFNAEQFERDITSGKLKDKILKDVVQKQKPEQLTKVVKNPAAGNNHNAQAHL